jgi:mono/diheme cytochrome c family protein
VVLEVGGDVKGGPFRLGEADLAALKQGKVHGVDPSGRDASWEGVDLSQLEERVELTKGADTLVVRSADRQATAIPLSVVRQLRPVVALRAGGGSLPAPTLAWPNVEHFGRRTDPRAPQWWVERVVRVDFVVWAEVYGRALHVPEGAPQGALAGARTYGTRCIGCHGMRGAGGAVGPDLAKGGDWTQPEKLRGILTGHPGWVGPGLIPPAEERIPELAAFLRTVALVGGAEDEAEPPPSEAPAPPSLTPPP